MRHGDVMTLKLETGLSSVSDIATLVDNKFWMGNASDIAKEITMSGDATISNTGVMSVSDLSIASEAQGDVLYFDGTNWVRLAPGTAGQFLKTQGAAANPLWGDVTPAMELVETITLGAAGTTFDFTGLDINSDGQYLLKLSLENNTAVGGGIKIYTNNDTTDTNYYGQRLMGTETTVATSNFNSSPIGQIDASAILSEDIDIIRTISGYFVAKGFYFSGGTTTMRFGFRGVKKTATVANITQLTLVSLVELKIGSKVSLFKLTT